MNTPKIYLATIADAETVGRMVNRLLCELVPDQYSVENSPEHEASARTLLTQGAIWAFLARRDDGSDDGGEAVGVLTLHQCHAIYAGGAFGEISELYVTSDFRSHRVGELLIKAAARFARHQGWNTLEVGAPDLPRWQRSVDFYKSQGFVEVGPRLGLDI